MPPSAAEALAAGDDEAAIWGKDYIDKGAQICRWM